MTDVGLAVMPKQVTADDLVVVRGSLDAGVRPMGADQQGRVVGRYAQVPLPAG